MLRGICQDENIADIKNLQHPLKPFLEVQGDLVGRLVAQRNSAYSNPSCPHHSSTYPDTPSTLQRHQKGQGLWLILKTGKDNLN